MLFNPFYAIASHLYKVGLSFDRSLRSKKAVSLSKPVISIGNLTVGGTGKTPLLIHLTQDLLKKKVKPAILTRGYLSPLKSSVPNDETILMSENLATVPMGIGSNRVASASRLLQSHSIDMFILDDGFQHWPIRRQANIVCLDCTDPWGGDHLLPLGRLRESVQALKRADFIVLTRTELVEEKTVESIKLRIKSIKPNIQVIQSYFDFSFASVIDKKVIEPQTFGSRKILAISSIGNPGAFEKNIKSFGLEISSKRYQDHYSYTSADIQYLSKKCEGENLSIITTEKDWVKLRKVLTEKDQKFRENLFLLRAKIQFPPSDKAVWDLFVSYLGASKS